MIFSRKAKLYTVIEYNNKGIILEVKLNEEHLHFPISTNYLKNKKIEFKDIKSLNLFQNLWLDDLMTSYKNQTYIIKYENLYEIYEEYDFLDKILMISDEILKTKIKNSGFVGSKNFNIIYEFGNSDYENLGKNYKKTGNVIHFNGKHYLLTKDQFSLIEEIDKAKVMLSLKDQSLHLAKVKKRAKKANALIDNYINNEDFLFPEKIDIDLIKHDDKHLECIPMFTDIDYEVNQILRDKDTLNTTQSIIKDNKYKRIFIEEDTTKKFNNIKSKRHIKGSDVPKFINNPYQFIPNEIDIKEFGERVKGLKIRTYKAQPFVNCNKDSKTGWFQFDTGINIIEDNPMVSIDVDYEDKKGNSLESQELKKIIKMAEKDNTEYIYYQDKWIKIDTEIGNSFIETVEKFKAKYEDGKVNPANVPLVLDIYENITNLEYNLQYIELKKQYSESDLLDYKKPQLLNTELYSYQEKGYQWLKRLKNSQIGGLLADDMGLGKTIQLIAFIAHLKEVGELVPTLIILPSSLIDNWIIEIKKFIPTMTNIYIHRGSKRCKDKAIIDKYDVVLTTYETLVRDQLVLGKIKWKLVVCDEAQKIKNATTLATTAVKALSTKYRVALTGTPVENSLSDLWCIIDYIQPGLLNSYDWFKKNYEIPIQKGLIEDCEYEDKANELIQLIEPVFLRRTKEDNLDKFPQKHELEPYKVRLSSEQLKYYKRIIVQGEKYEKKTALADIQNLLQICSHPRLFTKDMENIDTKTLKKESPKLDKTIQIIKEIKKKNEKVIIFTKYRLMQDIFIKALYDEFGIIVDCINGSVTKNRIDLIDRFQSKEGFNVLILSPRAAGVGLNIVGANHVIHYTRDWNPAVENQATDRTYRIGQEKDVYVYYPICTTDKGITVEERLDQLLKEKKKLVKQVIVPADKFIISEKDFHGID